MKGLIKNNTKKKYLDYKTTGRVFCSMISAFVMVNTLKIHEQDVIDKIRTENKVKEIYQVSGVYNFILKVEEDDIEALKQTIIRNIKKDKSIKSTMTLIVNDKNIKFLKGGKTGVK